MDVDAQNLNIIKSAKPTHCKKARYYMKVFRFFWIERASTIQKNLNQVVVFLITKMNSEYLF